MEYIDVVDIEDTVIGKASRDDVYAKALMHRIVHVFVFNNKQEMLLQKRSMKASFCPGHWSTAVGGHVQSGETPETAASRESQEEIGVTMPLTFLSKDLYKAPGTPDKFLITFTGNHDGPFVFEDHGVESASFFSLDNIKEMVDAGEQFHPELLFLLKRHYGF